MSERRWPPSEVFTGTLEAMSKAIRICEWHDLPLVCGECGAGLARCIHQYPGGGFTRGAVHRIPDPEGIEGTTIMPCGLG